MSPARVAELRTFCIMLRYGIAQFVGSWVSESGYHLRIKKVDKDRALVDFLDPRAAPVQRPYMGGAPTLKRSRTTTTTTGCSKWICGRTARGSFWI